MHNHDGDRMLFSVFEKLGVSFTKPREINFYFVFSEQDKANAASSILQKRNLAAKVHEIRQPWWKRLFAKSNWSVSITRQMPMDRDVIMKMTTLFQQIATRCGGTYDGWEASVVGDNLDPSNFENL